MRRRRPAIGSSPFFSPLPLAGEGRVRASRFTPPTPTLSWVPSKAAAKGGPALIIGSTGFAPEQLARIDAAASKIAIVRSGNYSLGVNMLMGLVRQAAAALPAEDWDIEVYEAHHKRKIDAPSGTALMLGEAAADGRGVGLGQVADRGVALLVEPEWDPGRLGGPGGELRRGYQPSGAPPDEEVHGPGGIRG